MRDFSFPNYNTVTGKKISELLKAPERDPLVLQALMTINRYECQDEILDAKRVFDHIIFDRYWLSGYVYGRTDDLDSNWLIDVHSRLIQPDCWIILDMPTEESFRRRPVRENQYEAELWRLELARKSYLDFAELSGTNGPAYVIDATQDEEIVCDDILIECGL